MTHIMTKLAGLAIWLGLALSLASLPLVARAQIEAHQDDDMRATYVRRAYGEGFPPACRDDESVAEAYAQLSDEAFSFLTRYCASNAYPAGGD